MIDAKTLAEARERYYAAQPAVETVRVHATGGLFGPIPPARAVELLPAAAASAADVGPLLDAVERLAPAAYISGPEGCCEGDCEEEETPAEGGWCSHVTERVATVEDVERAALLADMLADICEAAERVERGEPADPGGEHESLAGLILARVGAEEDRLARWAMAEAEEVEQ